MSSFCGRMREYKDISLDRFDGENLESTVYMLSHKHQDHMVGMAASNFAYRLQTNMHIKLYCSDVTRDLLLAEDRFKWLAKSLVVHELEVPCSVPVLDAKSGMEKYRVTMTMIPAGHCPGSVMFLLEGDEGTALYTGDFRLARGDISRIECLRCGDRVKRIDSLYIDTTFCVPQAFYIPSREDCTQSIINVVKDWIKISKDHMIVIHQRASLGYEQLFIELAEYFATKIHVSQSKHVQCLAVKKLPLFTTTDPTETQIHACKWSKDKSRESPLPCGYLPKPGVKVHVKIITVSTMWFTQQVSIEDIIVVPHENKRRSLRACYSFHSSYSEVRDVVLYLKPSRVLPNVIPMGNTREQIQERLDRFLLLTSVGRPPSTPSMPRKLGQLRAPKKRRLSLSGSQFTDSDLDLFDGVSAVAKKPRTQTTATENEEALNLQWSVSQSSISSNSQPTDLPKEGDLPREEDVEVQSSYASSRRGSASDLLLSEFDLTPQKNKMKSGGRDGYTPKKEDPSEKPTRGVENGGVAPDETEGEKESQEFCSDNDGFMDVEVRSTRESFKPVEAGSYGSHVSYVSDLDLVYPVTEDDSEGNVNDVTMRTDAILENGDIGESDCVPLGNKKNHAEEPSEKTRQRSPTPANVPVSPSTGMLNTLTKKTSDIDDEYLNSIETNQIHGNQKNGADLTAVTNGKPHNSGSGTEAVHGHPTCEVEGRKRLKVKEEEKEEGEVTFGEDDSPDVIMLDTDDDNGTHVANSDTTVDESSQFSLGEKGTPDVPIIDLTADDDDDDVISLGISRYYGDDGDGYHGDSESDDEDSDGIMAESDESFAKASYEKTKTRIKNGRSRRATQFNGFSSTDSDMDSDVTVDSSYKPSARLYPIAGSSHYTTSRLNGFHSTLVDNEVIILDDDPPSNVSVNNIVDEHVSGTSKKSNAENCTTVNDAELLMVAMEKPSVETAIANSRLSATIVKLKSNLATPVIGTSVTNAQMTAECLPGIECTDGVESRSQNHVAVLNDKGDDEENAPIIISAKRLSGTGEMVGVLSCSETTAATGAKDKLRANSPVGVTAVNSGNGSAAVEGTPVLTPLTPVQLGLEG